MWLRHDRATQSGRQIKSDYLRGHLFRDLED